MLKKLGTVGLAAIAGSSLLVGPAFAVSNAIAGSDGATGPAEERATGSAAKAGSIDVVEGKFTYNQTELSTNEEINRALGRSAKYLCGSQAGGEAGEFFGSSLEWTISVGGEVENEFSATLEELSEEGASSIVMGCSCAGNLAGGLATANAGVMGVTVSSIMEAAGVAEGANTIVFSSEDGYEVALPLSYVAQRYSLIVYEVNGDPVCDSIGGANQLWLGSTSAKYFVRNVSSISFEERQTPPPAPYTEGAEEHYGNFPAIGATSAKA